MSGFDTILRDGLVFDGSGAPARRADLGIRAGRVVEVSEQRLPESPGTEVVDAAGLWVTPGFIDLHTHYDAEVEVAPSLSESTRHGVTTVVVGSCSLSFAVGDPVDLADMFCRVEAIPRAFVEPVLRERKTWTGPRDYLEHLETLALGPNIASFLGHSAARAASMGLERSLTPGVVPTGDELAHMDRLLEESIAAGYLGFSIQTLPWDKMGGDRFRSRPLPSTFARWSEYRHFNRALREAGRVFQGVPNVSSKVNALLFMLESVGIVRKPLKTTVISLMDVRSDRMVYKLVGALARVVNGVLGGDFRLQALPEVFDLWADGIDLVVFEEFGAGAAALHVEDAVARGALLKNPDYRAWFRRQWRNKLLPKVFHRDFNESLILACPDPTVVGRSFAEVAAERDRDVVETFLELVAEHGVALRWYTVMANDRREPLEEIMAHPDVLIGFSDAGAHLRQMAHYNFPLRMLHKVKVAEASTRPFMPMERAVHRLTGEIADWLGIDAGHLSPGSRADVVLLDPAGLTDQVEAPHEAAMEGFAGLTRMVRRNDRAIRGVWINGKRAVADGQPLPELGRSRGYGTVLRAS